MSFAFNFLTVSLLDRFENLPYAGLSYLLLRGSEIRFACLQLACGQVDLHLSSIWTETKLTRLRFATTFCGAQRRPFPRPIWPLGRRRDPRKDQRPGSRSKNC